MLHGQLNASEVRTRPAVPVLVLRLVGPLRLFGPDGEDLTPSNVKPQGLLALLGTSPNLRRARGWIQDKLWSNSPPEQGAQSLRQTVLRLRRALGPYEGCLVSERGWIWLLSDEVRVVRDPAEYDWRQTDEIPELFEGLDIHDPEFEDWARDQRLAFADRAEEARDRAQALRHQRLRSAAVPQASARPAIVLAPCEANTLPTRTLGTILTGDIAALVAEIGGAEILTEPPRDFGLPTVHALRLQIRAYDEGGVAVLRALIEDPTRHTLLRSLGRTITQTPASSTDLTDTLQVFAAEVANVVCFELGRGRTDATEAGGAAALGYRALEYAGTFTREALGEADRLFARAFEGFPSPVYLAWQAQVRLASTIERYAPNPKETLREAMELAKRALAADPFNAVVMAHASDVVALSGHDPDAALALARSAVDLEPANAFAHASLAYRLAWTSDVADAHAEAIRALRLASRQPRQVRWTMRCCLTAARSGRYKEALLFGLEAHRLEPAFKPPLRFLAALSYQLGDEAGAAEALQKLRVLEPDFTLDLLRNPEYPIATLRGTPLMRLADSGLI